ncbi:MAG: ABC transporter ATP-binding protein/permease [Anaerolineae bacterium]|nr:ABC transporter ATP-binding protein/permease [Anaerolineae bacterium]
MGGPAIMHGLDADKYDRQYTDADLMRRIARYFAVHQRRGLIVLVAFVVLAVIQGVQPLLIADGVDALEAQGSHLPELVLGALFVAAFVQYIANRVRRQLLTWMVANVVAQMRKDAVAAAIERDLAFYDENNTGKIVSRITNDTQDFGEIVMVSSDIINQVLQLIILVAIMLERSVLMTGLLIATTPLVIAAALVFRRLARYVTRQSSRQLAVVNGTIQESVSGISVAKNFRQEGMIYSQFVEVNNRSYDINLQRGLVLALVFPVLTTLSGLGTALVVYVGAQLVFNLTISAAVWFLFIQGTDRFWFPFMNIASFWSQFQQGLSATERVFGLIDADNSIIQHDHQPAGKLEGHIEFEDVTFEYVPGDPVLKRFDLDIARGESVAFVGHTGAGKSTIAKLITRFYEFQRGQIRVDGRDIRSFDLQSYRSQLGIVPQAPFLFSGTILENIRYSKPDATDAEIEEIALSIGGGEWLETLPDGLNSDVGERGARLSMGQRQLVSLLRVLLQHPAIFILDEATASIDPFTETQIQEALDMILARSTSILIAHRLSTVRSADRIIVLREGAIIEEGSHESLMEQGGHYADLYNTYFRHQSLSYIEGARERFASQSRSD